jgi:general stress protein 26
MRTAGRPSASRVSQVAEAGQLPWPLVGVDSRDGVLALSRSRRIHGVTGPRLEGISMSDQPGPAKVAELAKDIRIAMLTTVDDAGQLVARPMALQDIGANSSVNVTLASGQTWISVYGHARVVEDPAKAEELWNAAVEAWFPQGPKDASVVLIKVDGAGAEYWDTPGGRLATAISFAKAKVTGQPYDGGENEQVSL